MGDDSGSGFVAAEFGLFGLSGMKAKVLARLSWAESVLSHCNTLLSTAWLKVLLRHQTLICSDDLTSTLSERATGSGTKHRNRRYPVDCSSSRTIIQIIMSARLTRFLFNYLSAFVLVSLPFCAGAEPKASPSSDAVADDPQGRSRFRFGVFDFPSRSPIRKVILFPG